ncbi:hypothetical protein VTI74DRAFT_5074 [Chaetomium olivicolor]
MAPLPLKAKIGIRDHWSKEDGPLQTTLRDLEGILGHNVVIDPEWPLIVAELDKFYDDKANMIAIVAGCVQAWAKSMIELLEDSAHEAWTEQLLEKVPVRMQVFVNVASSAKAATAWSEQRSGFVVSLPQKQVYQPAELFPIFRAELLACFETRVQPQSPEKKAAGDAAADGWAGVELDTASGRVEVIETPKTTHQVPARSKVEFMPSAASLPRPDLLLLQPPYHLTMTSSHQCIELQCSHSPSLEFLADYLKRWCRVNHADTRNPPAVEVTLHQSAFGLGEMFDRLTLSTEETRYTNRFRVTAPMIVSLIEGVLGYQLTSTRDAWIFRRDTEFKTL